MSSLIGRLKAYFYFPVAFYFAFFAWIRLAFWKPRIVVVTGSSGKTSTLHLIESQIGPRAKYSHHANSAIGVPFNILGIHRKTLLPQEWIKIFLLAPVKTFAPLPKQKLYIVEADCDRPGEGKFLSFLLRPEATIWLSSARTHSVNFDKLVASRKFKTVEEAIAYEFGHFVNKTKKLVIVNADSELILRQLYRTSAKIIKTNIKRLRSYDVGKDGSAFKIGNRIFSFKYLLPEEFYYSLAACLELTNYLGVRPDYKFSKLSLPPGRNSLFKGIKNTLLVDSSYNANLSSMTAVLGMFEKISSPIKWAVVGDMIEQGVHEKEEHEKLAELLLDMGLARIVLLGPRVSEYTYPKLVQGKKEMVPVDKFLNPKDVLVFLKKNIKGEELILFKGARFMEGIIEHLLKNKEDAEKLARREKVWERRRKRWGL